MSFHKIVLIIGLFVLFLGWTGVDDAKTLEEAKGAQMLAFGGNILWMVGVTLHLFSFREHEEEMKMDPNIF